MENEQNTVALWIFIGVLFLCTWVTTNVATEVSYTDDICKIVSVKTEDYLKCKGLDKPNTLKLLKEKMKCQKQ